MKRDRIYWASSVFDLGRITLAQNSDFMQMKVIYFHMFKQMVVNFGKFFFFLVALISISLLILFIFFPFYCKLFPIVLKEKNTSKHWTYS